MKFSAVVAFFAAGALASPVEILDVRSDSSICPVGLYANAQCCSVIVLGLIALGCTAPFETPRDGKNFQEICARSGKQAGCCAIPVAGQSLLCNSPVGAN